MKKSEDWLTIAQANVIAACGTDVLNAELAYWRRRIVRDGGVENRASYSKLLDIQRTIARGEKP